MFQGLAIDTSGGRGIKRCTSGVHQTGRELETYTLPSAEGGDDMKMLDDRDLRPQFSRVPIEIDGSPQEAELVTPVPPEKLNHENLVVLDLDYIVNDVT